MSRLAALLGGGEEGGVGHMERIEGAFGEKRGIWPVGGGLEGVAEEIEPDVGVESGGSGSSAEMLVGQPAPAGAAVGEGEVRRAASGALPSSRGRPEVWVARSGERDGVDAVGYEGVGGGVELERVVEADGACRRRAWRGRRW